MKPKKGNDKIASSFESANHLLEFYATNAIIAKETVEVE